MVGLKTIVLVALLLVRVLGFQMLYEARYIDEAGQDRATTVEGPTITHRQKERVQSNIHLWSDGRWQTREVQALLIVFNTERVRGGFNAANEVIAQMRASITHRVRGGRVRQPRRGQAQWG